MFLRQHPPQTAPVTPTGPVTRTGPAGPAVPGDAAPGHAALLQAARDLNRASALLAACVLADSAAEHYRGSFHNKAMYTPLISAALALTGSLHGAADRRTPRHRGRDAIYLSAAAAGVAGAGFHLYNVLKRPGGFCWQNLFYSAPLGAPGALLLSGLLGLYAERLRDADATAPRVLGLPAARGLAGLTCAGLLGTVAEAALLHFRGAFHNPAMVLPVSVPPVAAALLAHTALGAPRRDRRFTRAWLRFTALLGFAGAGFHAVGVQRNMGGWRNWRQNLFNGPPLPAPPGFTALALAGLAALALLKEHSDA